jgi:hypothetical protein
MVGRPTLNPVRVVTHRTGRSLLLDVLAVRGEGAITQEATTVVALVAECIGLQAFERLVCGSVLAFQEEAPRGPMGTTGPAGAGAGPGVAGVAIRAIDDGGFVQRGK